MTPPDSHEEIAVAAVKAGKHVTCEKPIANDAPAAERMWAAANETEQWIDVPPRDPAALG